MVYDLTTWFPLFVSSRCDVNKIFTNECAAKSRRAMTKGGLADDDRRKDISGNQVVDLLTALTLVSTVCYVVPCSKQLPVENG